MGISPRALPFAFLLSVPLWSQCGGSEPIVTTVAVVQGNGPTSPCTSRVVTLSGVVTAALPSLSGFFIQDAGDGNPATSDGVFVFTGSSAGLPAAESVVRVTGRAVEFSRSGYTGSVTEIDVRASATTLARVEVLGRAALPLPAALDPAADLEALEGMYVRYGASAVVQPANRFGEYFTLPYNRLPGSVRPTLGALGGAPPLEIGAAFRKSPKVYDLVPELHGVLHFDFGYYRLESVSDYTIDDGGLRPTAAPASPFVASLNTERLLRNIGDAALELKLAKLSVVIRESLRSPALVAVQEVGDVELLAELGRRAGGYEAVLLRGCDPGGINTGLLYDPARFSLVSASQIQTEAPDFRNGRCTLPDGRSFQQYLYDRPPLVVELLQDTAPLTVIVNHWRSQIGDTFRERVAGAQYLASRITALGARRLIALGDFNDVEYSQAVLALEKEAGLLNVTTRAPWYDRYSLIFEGVSLCYDHILTDAVLAGRLQRSGYAHVNADFPPDSSARSPVRAADHDNPWVIFR